MSVPCDNRYPQQATVLVAHAQILHGAGRWHHVRRMDLVGQDGGLVEAVMAENIRLAGSNWRQPSPHQATATNTVPVRWIRHWRSRLGRRLAAGHTVHTSGGKRRIY